MPWASSKRDIADFSFGADGNTPAKSIAVKSSSAPNPWNGQIVKIASGHDRSSSIWRSAALCQVLPKVTDRMEKWTAAVAAIQG
jgi:hypothetical protein